ncbi:8641_t:CDS:2 [Paraglomus occultum]|uniref:Transcription elongation factor SPT4 n=1 Tax=Paraglomus occultum TaxID=144539 RepID=A0A9N9A274_9GLOM|nr:8641_t:CDS:2 [Paraglomus occultum]
MSRPANSEANRSIPSNFRQLRACLLCSLVKNYEQFRRDGCDNCEDIVQMRNNSDRIADCTSSSFDGFIASMKPTGSWVSKFKKIDNFVPGIYAVGVNGHIPDWLEYELKRNGIPYVSRDGTLNPNSSLEDEEEE